MKRKGCFITLITILGILILGVIIIIIIIHPNPDPAEIIRNQVLEQTPKGMSMDDVLEIIEANDEWKLHGVSYDGGFVLPYDPVPGWPTTSDGQSIIGEKSIRARLEASYPMDRLFFHTTVSIFWGFDKDEKLVEVYIWRNTSYP